MSKIYEGTALGTGKIRIQKNVGDILLVTPIPNFENLKMTVYIDRPNDNNHEICTDAPVVEFATLVKMNPFIEPIQFQSNESLLHFIRIELGVDYGLLLQNGDVFVIEIYGMPVGTKTIFNLDDVEYANQYRKLETKNILSDEMSKIFVPNGSEFVSVRNQDNVRLVVIKTNAGHRLEYTPFELKHMMRDVYPSIGKITDEDSNNSTSVDADYPHLLIPTFDCESFEIFKQAAGVVPVTFMYDREFQTMRHNPLGGKPAISGITRNQNIK